MSIFVRTGDPAAVVDRLSGAIAERQIGDWSVDRFGNYFHDHLRLRHAAFFAPSLIHDGLRLDLHFANPACDRRHAFAVFHGAMAQVLILHCGDRFEDLHLTKAPQFGDAPF